MSEIRYATTTGGKVAYRCLGDGPHDIVLCDNWITNLEVAWENPLIERCHRHLATFGRLIVFDKRGTGISDPVEWTSSADVALRAVSEWAIEDILSILDDLGSQSAVLLGCEIGGWYAMHFAASHPDRTKMLVLTDPVPRVLREGADPYGLPPEMFRGFVERVPAIWGTGRLLMATAPDLREDARLMDWLGRYERLSCPPSLIPLYWESVAPLDQTALLSLIQAPVLVIDHDDNAFGRAGPFIVEQVPNGQAVLVHGRNRALWAPQPPELWDAIARQLTDDSVDPPPFPDRVLAAVVFTDFVGSTERVAEMGDSAWSEIIETHERIARKLVDRYLGRYVKSTGDGVLATFDGPGRATACALALRDELRLIGITIRAGIHVGEVEVQTDDVGGIAVHVAARVLGKAADGEVWASRTVKDLVAGSVLMFEDRGVHVLKGIAEEWQLFAVTGR